MRPQNAFTLIELLVVLALISTLAALLLPVIARAGEEGRRARCLSNVRQIGQAHRLYLEDWDEQLTHWWIRDSSLNERSGVRRYRYWTEFLRPYLQSDRVFHDPGALASEVVPPGVKLADYALGTWGPEGSGWPNDPYWRWPGPPLSLAQVKRPSETMSLTDGYTTTVRALALVPRHRGGIHVSFLDGRAKWMGLSESYQVADDREGLYQHERWYFYRYITANR